MNPAPPLDFATLIPLTPGALRALWPQWFDRPPPAKIRREFLIRALAYRMQERDAGGLTTARRTTLRALAEAVKNHSKWDGLARPRLTPGTHLIREWGNERLPKPKSVPYPLMHSTCFNVAPTSSNRPDTSGSSGQCVCD